MSPDQQGVILLLPGVGNNERLWAHQVATLRDRYQLSVARYDGATSIRQMADSALTNLPEGPFSLLGFSLGASIALDIVERYPQRVERLALLSASPFADTPEILEQRQSVIDAAHADYRGMLERMSKFIVCEQGPNALAARKTLLQMGEELGVAEFCRQQQVAMARKGYCASLATIRCPAQVLCGADDPVTPVNGNRYLAEHIPGATIEILAQSGHLLPLERPFEVSEFLRDWMRSDCADSGGNPQPQNA